MHVSGLAVLDCPYFRVESRVVTFEQLFMFLYPVAEVIVAQTSLVVTLDFNFVVVVDLEGEILHQGAHVAVLYLVLELVLVDFQVGALVVVLQQRLVGKVEGSCGLGMVFRLEGIELVYVVLKLETVVFAQFYVPVALHHFVLQQNLFQLFLGVVVEHFYELLEFDAAIDVVFEEGVKELDFLFKCRLGGLGCISQHLQMP